MTLDFNFPLFCFSGRCKREEPFVQIISPFVSSFVLTAVKRHDEMTQVATSFDAYCRLFS